MPKLVIEGHRVFIEGHKLLTKHCTEEQVRIYIKGLTPEGRTIGGSLYLRIILFMIGF